MELLPWPVLGASFSSGAVMWGAASGVASDHGGHARLMLVTTGPAPVEVWRWRLHPGEAYPSRPHQAGVVETISVTTGRMTLTLDGTEHTVTAGQTAAFDGDATHTYSGSGTAPCDLIMTVQLPPVPAPAP